MKINRQHLQNFFILVACCFYLLPVYSQELPPPHNQTQNLIKESEKPILLPEAYEAFSETDHEITINGKIIPYRAVAGNLILKDDKGNPKASIFYISYTKKDPQANSNRPITFCFNGGPGSSSVWLHLGAFGPKRVQLTEKGEAIPPYHLIENEYSILDFTDLVFVDPISTGYSRAIPPEDAKKYHGFEEDIKSIAEFIRLYITRYNRWDSPKFIAGESYGTTRAIGLADYLHNHDYLYMNGIILVSSILNFQTILFNEGNDLSSLAFLPSYTATAWYHNKLAPDLQANLPKALDEARSFTMNEYNNALFKGDLLKDEERQFIAGKLARLTGLSPQYVLDSDLRISDIRFVKELLRKEKRTVGRFDSRFLGIDTDILGENFEYDPSADAIFGAFTSTLNYYMRNDLKWERDGDYKILASLPQWDYSVATNQYLNVTDKLISAMVRNPHLQVFVASGYYDLATPFFGTEYTFNHLGVEKKLKDHIDLKYYEAGHMMYIHQLSLVKLKADLAEYYEKTLKK